MLANLLFRGPELRASGSFVAAMWGLVAIFAISGKIERIRFVSMLMAIIQCVVFFFAVFFPPDEETALLVFGAHLSDFDFALAAGVGALIWIALFLWAKWENSRIESASVDVATPPRADYSEKRQIASIQSVHTQNSPDRKVAEGAGNSELLISDAADILLQYDDSLRRMLKDLDGLPTSIKERFLANLVENPNEHAIDVRNRVLLNALGRPDLLWTEEFENIFAGLRRADVDDIEEFFRVFPVLSRRKAPLEVFRMVIEDREKELHIAGAGGRIFSVTKRGTGAFLLKSHTGVKTFFSLGEVYDYLGTPESKRR